MLNERFSIIFCYVVGIVSPLIAALIYVWMYQDAVRLGYTITTQENRRKMLTEEYRVLQAEYASLHSPSSLGQLAQRYHFEAPRVYQWIEIKSSGVAHLFSSEEGMH